SRCIFVSRASSLPQIRVFSNHARHSHRSWVFSSHVKHLHRSGVFQAMWMLCGSDDLVGASLLANTVFQSMHF
ncbi:hypothetical protein ALP61_03704, partial [Pseudomonas savastanoi]